ncbi:MAG: ferrochelatase [Kiritimatiellae bacterium]|nr:ferrochelatase [Kiritimatiellia bacterium]
MNQKYDAILIVSFGGPERKEDVMPFLDNVLRGKNVPLERKREVAHHYERFDGVSPINEQNRNLIKALRVELKDHGIDLPIYWGNRNWHPLLVDTIKKMKKDQIKRVLAFCTSAYSSYSGCRQYRENIEDAREKAGERAPVVDKIRVFYNHPGFIKANCDSIEKARGKIPETRRQHAQLVFTAHSIPLGMAKHCAYEKQLKETCHLVAADLQHTNWCLVYQSRSGPPTQAWLGPDICDELLSLKNQGVVNVIVSPIGFISDHLEILYDLDTEAHETCKKFGLHMVRAETAGTHPSFISMIRELIEERTVEQTLRRYQGKQGPWHDSCPEKCCRPLNENRLNVDSVSPEPKHVTKVRPC